MKMRLIDEDVLAGESVKILTWLIERQKQGISTTLGELHEKWIDAVRKAPTAYDLDKVVEKLEDYLFEKYCVEGDTEIERIVKGGGVDGQDG